jgi:hypothetical protein
MGQGSEALRLLPQGLSGEKKTMNLHRVSHWRRQLMGWPGFTCSLVNLLCHGLEQVQV